MMARFESVRYLKHKHTNRMTNRKHVLFQGVDMQGRLVATTYGCYRVGCDLAKARYAGLRPETGRVDDGGERRAERMCSSSHGAPPNRLFRRGHARRGG